MSTNYKIKKYKQKLLGENNERKKKIYMKKLRHYNSIGGSTKLMLPIPADISSYRLEDYLNGDNKIRAIAYGNFKEGGILEPVIFERRAPRPNDVLVQIYYAGVCHSDWHNITGEWSSTYPLIAGHELTGKVVRIGDNVKKFKIGDMVAIGAFINSCRVCQRCIDGQEQYCERGTTYTYNSRERNPGDYFPRGDVTYGAFSNIMVANEDFVFPVPKNLPLNAVAPLTDAGLTVYAPLKRFVKPGMKVGIIGIGGLGHMAIKFAKIMGAYVVAITTSQWKLQDTLRIGANESVLSTNKKELEKYDSYFDFMLDTIPVAHDPNIYLKLLNFAGRLHIVGNFDTADIDLNNLGSYNSVSASAIGGIPDMTEMLEICEKNNIVSDIEIIPISYINKTYDRLLEKNVKYRFVIDIINTL